MQNWIRYCVVLFAFIFIISARQTFAAIEMQPHQKLPVSYLLNHPEQKGLLLYHSLGSGKTYVALEYAEKDPKKKVIILLPEFLKSNWITQMKSYGIKDSSRYGMISFNESEKILKHDLSQTVVIIDEVHKLIQKIRVGDTKTSERLIAVYQKIKTADKLLLLSGTPIFVDTSDIAYLGNLFESDDRYPIDPIKFRTEFMRVKPVTSLVRGHVTESKLMLLAFPFLVSLTSIVTLGTSLPWAIPLMALSGSAAIPVANEIFPINQVSFREFDASKWKDFAQKYISYYHVKLAEDENYPSKNTFEKKVLYNDFQSNFFLSFVDEDLNLDQLKIMLMEDPTHYMDQYLKIHSSRFQKQLLGNTYSGLEIGNLDFKSSGNEIIEPPKFLEILKTIQASPGQVAVYSNYFANGIKRFASFLDRHGLGDQYALLTPDQSVQAQINVVDQYNKAKKRILLIHPEITEGVSLNGTEQFHVLEPIGNSALLEQVVGRAIRYRSHAHLPKERRNVNVYLWESNVEYSKLGLPTSSGLLRREHWQRKYSEVNPSIWTQGITSIDSTYFLKDETPDQRLKRHKSAVERDVESFKNLLKDFNIDKV
ncbi:MAG: helicase-related protein [Bdellovibrionia bacterium]